MYETWTSRDFPVLEAAVRAVDADFTKFPEGQDIALTTGLDVNDVGRAFKALDGHYLAVSMTMGGPARWHVTEVSPEARRVVGQWPSPEALVDKLVSSLNAAAEREGDPEKRSKLRATAGTVAGIAREIFVEVAAATITGRSGLAGGG